jgi:hypothetical protein
VIQGGCQCGAVRYAVEGDPTAVFICHCTECRRQSASAFGISVDVPAAALRVVEGTTRTWARPTPAGRLVCHFCATCGSRLWHESDPPDGCVTLKGGCMDVPPDLVHAVHIWTASKLPGVPIPPDAEQYPGEPDRR